MQHTAYSILTDEELADYALLKAENEIQIEMAQRIHNLLDHIIELHETMKKRPHRAVEVAA